MSWEPTKWKVKHCASDVEQYISSPYDIAGLGPRGLTLPCFISTKCRAQEQFKPQSWLYINDLVFLLTLLIWRDVGYFS